MKNINMWFDVNWIDVTSFGNVTELYDRSGKGNNVSNGTPSERPRHAALSSKFRGGTKVAYFYEQVLSDQTLENDSATLTSVFGTPFPGSPLVDPEFEFAAVIAEHPDSTSAEMFFGINSSTYDDQVWFGRHNTGASFRVRGSVDNTFDTSDGVFADNKPSTYVFSCQQDGEGEMNAYAWIQGNSLDWDDEGISSNYPMDPGTLRGMDEIILGGMVLGTGSWHGYVAEMILWSGKHSAAERTQTLNYLRDKWDCS